MASTYSAELGIELMATGEDNGTWGTKTNNNLSPLIESAICGRATANFATDANLTISITDGVDSTGRYYIINATSGVSLTATRQLICPLRAGKNYVVFNNTTGGQSITVIGATGTGVTIPNGKTGTVYNDGTNYKQQFDWLTGLTLAGTVTGPDAGTWTSSGVSGLSMLGIGMTPTNILDVTQNQNAASIASILNNNGSGAATAFFQATNGTAYGRFGVLGTAWSSNGVLGNNHAFISTNSAIAFASGDAIKFAVNGSTTEVARFDTSGNLLIGTTSAPATQSHAVNANGFQCANDIGTGYFAIGSFGSYIARNSGTGQTIWYNAQGNQIVQNQSNGVYLAPNATSWSAISQREKKTDFEPITNALDRIQAHEVQIGRYKSDPVGTRRAFLFYEDAIQHWDVAAHGEGEFRGVAKEDYVPLFIQAIKDLRAEQEGGVKQLRAEIARLKAD